MDCNKVLNTFLTIFSFVFQAKINQQKKAFLFPVQTASALAYGAPSFMTRCGPSGLQGKPTS